MSKEYKFTPDEIRWLTIDELEVYCDNSDDIPSESISLYNIKMALFSYFGVKERPIVDKIKTMFPMRKVTADEINKIEQEIIKNRKKK